MHIVDFFNLERSLQDRFVEAAQGAVAPTPIAFTPARSLASVWVWWAACLLATFAAFAVLATGFGSLESSRAMLGAPWLGALAVLFFAAALAALRALALAHARDSLPYRAGAYLFPIGVVDAPSGLIKVYRFPDLSQVSRHGKRVTLVFDKARFDFETADPSLAEQLLQTVEQSRQRVSGGFGPPSSRELAGLDPLAITGFKSPFTPSEPRRKSSPRWLRLAWLWSLLAGAILGPLAWKARNLVSEERFYAEARALGTTAAFNGYLARGGARTDVSQVLLPRAELQEAIAKNSVRALEEFMARGKHSHIDAEVQVALKRALLAELNQAKGSLTELAAFERAQPHRELVKKEIELKRAELYQNAARAFSAVAQPTTPGLVGFFGRLLFYAQGHGPEVQIVFRRRQAESSKEAETQLTKSAYFMGPDALPSRYFRPEDWARREAENGQQLESRLNQAFAPDVLHFSLGPALDDDGSDTPTVDRPTLLITHRDELSGAFMSKRPRGAFMGLGLTVRSALLIPGDAEPLTFKFSAWLPPDLKKWEGEGSTVQDVYEALARDGLSRYTKKQLAFFFKLP